MSRLAAPLAILCATLALTSCGSRQQTDSLYGTPAGADDPDRVFQTGKASFYSDRLAGRPTAGGEPYDPDELTAAHRTLPFGAMVEVTRRDGRRVVVRINDRGPYAKGRIIDLSRRAARTLEMTRDGVAEVTLRVLSLPPRPKGRRK
ncbi:MAG: septal ring lytic transglycosylase RlpA family protein [Minicystis sp.]